MSVYGPSLPPEIIEAARTGGRGHPEIDKAILERHKLTVAKIDEDPSLVEIAVQNLERWRALDPERPKPWNIEWMDIIKSKPWSEIREMLLEDSEEGQRLRSSSPFGGILTEEERNSVKIEREPWSNVRKRLLESIRKREKSAGGGDYRSPTES